MSLMAGLGVRISGGDCGFLGPIISANTLCQFDLFLARFALPVVKADPVRFPMVKILFFLLLLRSAFVGRCLDPAQIPCSQLDFGLQTTAPLSDPRGVPSLPGSMKKSL